MTKAAIFLIEDNKLVRDTVSAFLVDEGYAVTTAESVRDVSLRLPSVRPDLILLDVVLPDGSGLELMKTIREHTDVPVIVVSGKSDMIDKIVGLEMGADDYIGKPLQMKEMAARIKAQLRRYKAMTKPAANTALARRSAAERLRFGAWTLDRPRLQAFDGKGAAAGLTVKEFRLLEALVMDPNRVLSREQLLDRMQEENYNVLDRAVDVHVLRIRKKIGDRSGPGEIIKSVRGAGYMLMCETEVL